MAFRVDDTLRSADVMQLEPPFRERALLLLERIREDRLPLRVWETVRDHRRQAAYYALGRTARNDDATPSRPMGSIVTQAKPGESAHEWGFALDLVLALPGVNPWSSAPKHARIWHRYALHAKELGLISGYLDWGWDKPHVELRGWRDLRPEGWEDRVRYRLEVTAGDLVR